MHQTPDVQLNNDIAITVHKFETLYDKGPAGELIERDMVHYSPQGDQKTMMIKSVAKLAGVLSVDECGDNIAYLRAHRLWAAIAPMYSHWKKNNALPETGTPLAAWGGVTAAQASVLKNAGLRSVEDVAHASEIVLGKTGLSNVVQIRDLAKKYLQNEDAAKAAAVITSVEKENAALKERLEEQSGQMSELMALVKELQADQKSKKTKAADKEAA